MVQKLEGLHLTRLVGLLELTISVLQKLDQPVQKMQVLLALTRLAGPLEPMISVLWKLDQPGQMRQEALR